MTRKLISLFLILGLVFTLLPLSAAAAGSPIINPTQPVDVLITADNTYAGSASGFQSALINALASQGLSANDVRILADKESVSLSSFDNWYVYDHYYNASYPTDGTLPTGWNDYSGMHKYYYYEEGSPRDTTSYYTDITTPGALDWVYYRDKHIYTSIDSNNNASMTFVGYSVPAYKDFLLYPTTDSNQKTVNFDIDAAYVYTHTLEGAGFLFNSGIDNNGYIYGYILFYKFSDDTSGTAYLLKINDGDAAVTADELHNGSSSSILNYTTQLASESFAFNGNSLKKHISVTITPDSVSCLDTDYTDAMTLETDPTQLFKIEGIDSYPPLTSTGYHGFGPIVSYNSHSCEEISAFTFSNLQMGYNSTLVESLRNATYIEDADKVFVVLSGSNENNPDDENYKELVTRLQRDEIFYVTTGNASAITDNGGNGLSVTSSGTLANEIAAYIAGIKAGTEWTPPVSLPSGTLPVAVFDITDTNEVPQQVMTVDRAAIGDDGLTLTFGNLQKSVAFGDNTITGYTYQVFDPSGNPVLGPETDQFSLTKSSPPGIYTFKLMASDGTNNSMIASRIVELLIPAAPPPPPTPVYVPDYTAYAIVNSNQPPCGTYANSSPDGQTLTTITLDLTKMNTIISGNENQTKIIIPVKKGMDNAAVVLTGEIVKNLAAKNDILEIMTNTATYTLPASLLKIDDIATQLGTSGSLSDIVIQINITKPSADVIAAATKTASDSGFTLAVPGFDFSITCTSGGKTAEIHSFDAYVQRTIAIPDGVDATKISTAVVYEADGTLRHVPTKIITVDGKYYALISSLTDSTYSLIWNPMAFDDAANNWSQNNINDLASRLVVFGTGNNNFSPIGNITRAEFIAMVVRALGLAPGLGENKFSDVKNTDWYCGYCETAASYGIVTGYSDGTLQPNQVITREEAMAILARAMKWTGLYPSIADGDLSAIFAPFKDSDKVSDFAKISVAACIKTGVIFGKTPDTIAPLDKITRAETAAIIERLLHNSGLI